MDCELIKTNIESYLDDELTLSDRRDFEEHVSGCVSCSNNLESKRAIKSMVSNIEYKNIPHTLRKNIQTQLRDYTGEENNKYGPLYWLSFGAGTMAIGSLATWFIMAVIITAPLQSQLADEIISSHVRSLMVDHVTDVKTGDRHTVKPWFNGRVDFSPPVNDLKESGFELLGGRLDYIQGKAVSALVYKRRAHIINSFIFKNDAAKATAKIQYFQRNGYNIVFWKKKGLDYWLISDLNKKELDRLALLTYKF